MASSNLVVSFGWPLRNFSKVSNTISNDS
jgi:hypothetical protein